MTGDGARADVVPGATDPIADSADVPRIVLDADGLDILELALTGVLAAADAVAAIGWSPEPAGCVLTDAENTPLALATAGAPGPVTLRALRPFALATGPEHDTSLRRPPASVAGTRVTQGFVTASLPTLVDLERVGAAARSGSVRLLLLLSRATPAGRPAAAALVRAWTAALAEARGPVEMVVVPWPATGDDPLDAGALGAAFGVAQATRLEALRTTAEAARLEAVDTALERALAAEYPPVAAAEALRVRRRAHGRGAVVFFTGLSGSGKSTIAKALAAGLAATSDHTVTLLDGDEVRQHLSKGLGFDAASRAANIDRIAWVASLVAAHGGIAVAAPIAPFDDGRRAARAMAVQAGAAFLLVHVSTSLEVCEARDRKGMYARARAGEIAEFTGISSPYEVPTDAEVVVDGGSTGVAEAAALVRSTLDAVLQTPAAG